MKDERNERERIGGGPSQTVKEVSMVVATAAFVQENVPETPYVHVSGSYEVAIISFLDLESGICKWSILRKLRKT